MAHSTSVIVSTYDSPVNLEKVLWGFKKQCQPDFQLIVADDGSQHETRHMLENFKQTSGMNMEHLWHEKSGCQKSMMLNKAVQKASGDYLIFTEGDCIPRKDFVRSHNKAAKQGHFVTGGHTNLPQCVSDRVCEEAISSGNAFKLTWLLDHGYPSYAKKMRLTVKGPVAKFFNHVLRGQADWNGHNASGWKKDLLNVNGFDERMKFGGEDREMGTRLINAGVKITRARYTAVCIHLADTRNLFCQLADAINKRVQGETESGHSRFTQHGIIKS